MSKPPSSDTTKKNRLIKLHQPEAMAKQAFALVGHQLDQLETESDFDEYVSVLNALIRSKKNKFDSTTTSDSIRFLRSKDPDEYGILLTICILNIIYNSRGIYKKDLLRKLIEIGFSSDPNTENKTIKNSKTEESKIRPGVDMKLRRMDADGLILMNSEFGVRVGYLSILPDGEAYLQNMLNKPRYLHVNILCSMGYI